MRAIVILALCSALNLNADCQTTHSDSIYFHQQLNSFAKGNNLRRFNYLKKYATRNQLTNVKVKTQGIDWLGIYRNVIVEKKGEVDSVVYIVCHYDKIDGNIISLVNLFINGSLDIILSNTFLSQGGYDNGTGVVSSLALMHWINDKPMHYTYRFLFAGMEEYGLRGSRRHVSSLSLKEWSKCVYAINIDMIAGKGINGVTMTEDVSHAVLKNLARHTSARTGIVMQEAQLPGHASSDFHSFKGQSFKKDFAVSFSSNFVGALIPQRSYFTKVKAGIPVINFTDDIRLNVAESFSIFSPVSFGQIHSLHDKRTRVGINNLVKYSTFFQSFIEAIDDRKTDFK